MTCRIGLVVMALGALGCGRVGFDEQAHGDADVGDDARLPDGDAPVDDAMACVGVGHDEDGDALDDACDPCPHLAGDAADADGDGVGDACDPSGASAQRIARFDTFAALPADWTPSAGVTLDAGQVVFAAATGGATLSRPWTPGASTFGTKFAVGAPIAAGQLLGIIFGDVPNNALHYCEFFHEGPTRLQLTYRYDGGEYLHDDSTPYPVTLANTQGLMTFRVTPALLTCVAELGGAAPMTVSAPPPAGIAPTLQNLYAQGVAVRFDWLIEIRDVE